MRLKRTVRITVTDERAVAIRPADADCPPVDCCAADGRETGLEDKGRGSEMNSLTNALAARFSEERAGGDSEKTDALIRAALSLNQAIEALGTINFLKGAKPPDLRRGVEFYAEVRRFEVALILEALRITRGSQSRAAALLGLNKTTLNCMIKRYGIDAESFTVKTTTTSELALRSSDAPERNSCEPQAPDSHASQDLAPSA
jgi:Bacterial regulatory protein, Fis family